MERIILGTNTKLILGGTPNQADVLWGRLNELHRQTELLEGAVVGVRFQDRRNPLHYYDKHGHDGYCLYQRQFRQVAAQEEYLKRMHDAEMAGDWHALRSLQQQLRIQMDRYEHDDNKRLF